MSAHHFLILAGLALSTLPCLVPMKRPRDVASPADGAPADADARRRQPAVIAYRVDLLPKYDVPAIVLVVCVGGTKSKAILGAEASGSGQVYILRDLFHIQIN